MRKFALVVTIFLFSSLTLSAQTDSIRSEPHNLLTTQVREQIRKLLPNKSDSLNLPPKIDTLVQLAHYRDTCRATNARDEIRQQGYGMRDSINRVSQKVSGFDGKVVEVHAEMQNRVNGINDKAISLGDEFSKKADSIKNNINSSLSSLEGKIESKVESITGQTIDIPEMRELNVPMVESVQTSLPNVDLPSPSDIAIDVPNTDQLGIGVSDLKGKLPSSEQFVPAKLNKVENLTSQLQDIDGKLAEVEKYESELQNIKDGAPEKLEKLPEEAEKKLSEISEVAALKSEAAKVTAQQAEYEAMLKKYQDRKILEAEIKRKAAGVANEYMAEHADKVQEAQKQLDKTKRGLAGVKSVKDVFKKRSNELDNKKFYQRLVPGVTWQWYKKDFVSVDFAVQVGYRLTPRLNAGIGWVYRTGFSNDFDYYVKGLQTYGGRAYLDFNIGKGVFAHGDFEMMKLGEVTVQSNLPAKESLVLKSYGSNFGLGKRFNITRNFRGNVQGLYHVNYERTAPSVNKVTARFGVEYVFRKQKKKFNGIKK